MWSVSRNKEEIFKIEKRAKIQIVSETSHLQSFTFWLPPIRNFTHWRNAHWRKAILENCKLEKSTLEKTTLEKEKHTEENGRNGNISAQISSGGTKESGCHPLKETSVPHPPILISTEEDETIFLLLFLADSKTAVSSPVMFSLWYIYTTCHSICNFHLKLSRVVKSPLPAILAVKCAPWRKRATPPLYNATLYHNTPNITTSHHNVQNHSRKNHATPPLYNATLYHLTLTCQTLPHQTNDNVQNHSR